MKLITIIALLSFIGFTSMSQTFEVVNGDTVNLTDINGFKQGKWLVNNKIKKLPKYGSDQLVEEGVYKNNRKVGVWTIYYPSGGKKAEITHVNGLPNGHAKFYFENGIVSEEGIWKINKWVGKYSYFYENGQKAYDFNYNSKGKREGKQTYFHENGNVMIEGNWENGNESGKLTEYWSNGEVKAIKNFGPGGKIDHTKTQSFEKPDEIALEHAEKGTEEEEAKEEEEKKKEEESVVVPIKEKENGPNVINIQPSASITDFLNFTGETQIKKNGRIIKEGHFVKGKLINGSAYTYGSDGKLVKIMIYEDGKVISTQTR